jgi:hypothetical protein
MSNRFSRQVGDSGKTRLARVAMLAAALLTLAMAPSASARSVTLHYFSRQTSSTVVTPQRQPVTGLSAGAASSDVVVPLQFADWTAISGTTSASGTLLGASISLSGSHVFPTPTSVLDGSWPFFAGPDFTPPLAKTDMIQIGGLPGDAYTLQFGAPVTDPVLEIASMADTMVFPNATQITKLSGQSTFTVAGNVVTGTLNAALGPDSVNDSNGTVQLAGTFTSIPFTVDPNYVLGSEDGILLQVGATSPPPSPPPPPPPPTAPTSPFPPPPRFHFGFGAAELRINGIEVTQGVQTDGCSCVGTLPSRDQFNLRTPGQATYQGVTLAAGHFTVVRVFADFVQPASLATFGGATVRLQVLDANGNQISAWAPDTAPARLTKTACACVTDAERADPNASFNFLIPWQETERRSLSFRATILAPVGIAAPQQCKGCDENTFLLSGVPFVQTANVPIRPIPLTVNTVATSLTVDQVFGTAQTVLPVNLQVYAYDAPLPIDGLTGLQALAAVATRASQDHFNSSQFPIGVFVDGAGQPTSQENLAVVNSRTPPAAIVQDANRPITSVMHEIGHGLGLVHADTGSLVPASGSTPAGFTGPHPDGSLDCGGNSGGQTGETWSPDNQGYIDGAGLDWTGWNIFQTGSLPRPVVPGFPTPATRYYDFMSYCPGVAGSFSTTEAVFDAQHWISVRNWEALLAFDQPPQTLPASAAAVTPHVAGQAPLRVVATVDASGTTTMFDVTPGESTTAPPTPGTPYRIELRDGAGHVLASVVPSTTFAHAEGQRPGLLLEGTLPFMPSGASVAVTGSGQTVATRSRSVHAPTARLVSPRAGAQVGRGPSTLVRWTESDADGDSLTATLNYSADGGRDWKVVADRLTGTSTRISNRLLSASRAGRLRLDVSDGFNVTSVMSAPLRVTGRPPVVRILGFGRGGRIGPGAPLLLQGQAFDDAGNPLTGGHLKWFADRRRIGTGAQLTAPSLPPGTQRIRLVATDAHGRSSHAQLTVRVLAAKPVFLVARAPSKVARTAHRLRMTIASNVPAVLRIGGARYTLGRKARTITITIRPGRSTLRLHYSLHSPGGTTTGTYVAAR